jgi:hypothetical protein
MKGAEGIPGVTGKALAGVLLLSVLLMCTPGVSRSLDVSAINRSTGLPSDWVTALAVDETALWVGTLDAGLAQLSLAGRPVRSYSTADGLPSNKVTSIASFKGKLYVGTDAGLAVFDGRSWAVMRDAAGFRLRNLALRADPAGGRLWVGSLSQEGALLRFDGERWEFLGGEGRGPLNHVQAFAFQGSAAWLGSMNSGVYRREGADFRYFSTAAGLPSSNVMSLEAYGGTVLAGTTAGVAIYEDGRFSPWPKAGGSPLTAVYAMASSPSTLYIGGREGLFRYRTGKLEPFPAGAAGTPSPVRNVSVLALSGETLYAGTPGGLLVIRGW